MKTNKDKLILNIAKKVIEAEISSIYNLKRLISKNFIKAIKLILSSNGKIVLTGIGKSGIIARKISATLSSTGSESVYIHPVEAMHGDSGIMADNDVIIALSNSGETEEIYKFLLFLKKKKLPTILITSNANSRIARISDEIIDIGVKKEACFYNIVPTSSTTAMLVIGDAIAISLMQLKGFNKENFANLHPGGNLGKILNIKIENIMRVGSANPKIKEDKTIAEAIKIMTRTSLGAISVINKKGKLVGFFTDGDLRRNFKNIKLNDPIKIHMTKNPMYIYKEDLANYAAKIMQEKKIDNLPVVNKKMQLIGILDERDLIKEGLL